MFMEEDFSKYNGEGTTLRKAQLRMLDILIEVDKICRKHNIPYWLDGGTLLGAVRHGGFIPWDDDLDIAMTRKDYLKFCKIVVNSLPDNLTFQNDKNDPNYFLKFAKVRDKNSFFDDPLYKNKNLKFNGIYIDIFPLEKMNSKYLKIFVEYIYGNAFRRARYFYSGKFKYFSGIFLMPFAKCLVFFVRLLAMIIPPKSYYTACGIPYFYEHAYYEKEFFPCKPILFEGQWFSGPSNPNDYLIRTYGNNYMKIPDEAKRIVHCDKIEMW